MCSFAESSSIWLAGGPSEEDGSPHRAEDGAASERLCKVFALTQLGTDSEGRRFPVPKRTPTSGPFVEGAGAPVNTAAGFTLWLVSFLRGAGDV